MNGTQDGALGSTARRDVDFDTATTNPNITSFYGGTRVQAYWRPQASSQVDGTERVAPAPSQPVSVS